MTKRRVVVTGIGTINPIGHNVEETWNGIENKKETPLYLPLLCFMK